MFGSTRPHPAAPYLLSIVVYIAVAQLAKQWEFAGTAARPFRPELGAAIAISTYASRKHRAAVIIVSIAVGTIGCDAFGDATWRQIGSSVVAQMLIAVVALSIGILLIRKTEIYTPAVTLGWFWSSILASAIGSVVGALIEGRLGDWTHLWQSTVAWGLGIYVVAPIRLTSAALKLRASPRSYTVELALTSVVLGVVTVYAFSTTGTAVYLVFPFLFWLCVRGGFRLGVPASIFVGICAVIATSNGNGPFSVNNEVAQTQVFLAVVFVSAGILVHFEETAEVRRARTTALLDAMPDLVVLTNAQGQLISQNDPAAMQDINVSTVLKEFMNADHDGPTVQVNTSTVEGRVIESRRLAVGDGTAMSIVRDVSDLVNQADQLAESNARWLRMSEAAQEGIAELDEHTIVRFANTRFAEIAGIELDELIGSHVSTIMETGHWRDTGPMRERAADGTAFVTEVGMVTRDNRPRWGLVSISPQINDDGAYSGAIVMITDITDVKAAEIARLDLVDELNSVERTAQARLARDLHDGPLQDLTAVQVILEHLANEDPGAPIVAKASAAMTDALAALRSGVRELDPVDVADGGIAEALRRYANRAIGASDIQIDVSAESIPPRGAAARVLYRIGREAITNATKHASPTTILISVSQNSESATLVVTDDGCGFDAHTGAVTGQMGLRSMMERARQADGEYELTSSPGGGTTVRAKIPLAQQLG